MSDKAMTTYQTIDGVPHYIGEARIFGLYYPARCTKCGWLGSSEDLTDEAECTRDEGDRLCLGYTEEVDAVYLLGVVQAMAKVAAQPQGEPVAWLIQCQHSGLVEQGEPNDKSDRPDEWSDSFPVYAEQTAPVAVVLPERMEPRDPYDDEANQWNACIDEVKRLNP